MLITQWSVKNPNLQQAAVSYNTHQRAFMKIMKVGEKEGQQRLLNPHLKGPGGVSGQERLRGAIH